MRPLTSSELLTVWERGLNQTLIQKTLTLLHHACPEMDQEDLAKLSVGQRDARLLKIRAWMFGPIFKNIADCPKCSELVEWETQMNDLQLIAEKNTEFPKEYDMEMADYKLRFRLPDTNDILKVITKKRNDPDPDLLLFTCILAATYKGRKIKTEKLPEKIISELSGRIEELDPMADIQMSLVCPNCSNAWQARFDIISYLWAEIDSWARRMFQDIYTLASAFGWSEKDILEMNPKRRSIYVEMLRA
jgi:hypothetical protein